jgi:prepilin-type processing-associated H-X9-DG protein
MFSMPTTLASCFVVALLAAAAALSPAAEPIDVSYVPVDAIAAVVVHPRSLLTSPEMEMLPIEVLVASSVDSLGIDPTQIEEAIGLLSVTGLPNGQPGMGAILRFAKAYDQQAVIDKLGQNTEPATHAGKAYRQSTAPAGFGLYMPDDRTMILATNLEMKSILSADKVDTPLVKLLRRLDTSAAAVAVVDLASLRPLVLLGMQSLPPVPEQMKEFLELPRLVEWVSLSLDLKKGIDVKVRLGAADAKGATRIEELAERGRTLAREFVSSELPALMESDKDPTAAAMAKYIQRMVNKLLDKLEITKQDQEVQIAFASDAPQLATIGVATALLLPAVQAAREAGRRNQSSNQLKQIGLAMLNYHDAQKQFPARAILDKQGKPLLSWRVSLLPYLDQKDLYDQFHLDEPWDSEHNSKLIDRMPAAYGNPNLPSATTTLYQVPAGKGAMFGDAKGLKIRNMTDGTSMTIMALEVNPEQAVPWTKPADLEYDPARPLEGLGKVRAGGFQALFADGHVTFISNDIDPDRLRALFTYAGREAVTVP